MICPETRKERKRKPSLGWTIRWRVSMWTVMENGTDIPELIGYARKSWRGSKESWRIWKRDPKTEKSSGYGLHGCMKRYQTSERIFYIRNPDR